MGCTSAKSINHRNKKNNQELLVQEIINVIDELDIIKEKYIYDSDYDHDNDDHYLNSQKIQSIEEFILHSYKTNRFTKQELQYIYQEIKCIFIRVNSLLTNVKQSLSELRSEPQNQDDKQKYLSGVKQRNDVEEVYTDFLNIFSEMTRKILAMPEINFDQYNYQLKKQITSAHSMSIIYDNNSITKFSSIKTN